MKYAKSLLDKAARSIRKLNRFRTLILALSVITVFVVTYLLILPAITLDEKEAERQGGIDIVTESTTAQGEESTQADQPAPAPDSNEKEKTTEQKQTQKASAVKNPVFKDGELSYAGKTFDIEAAYKKDAKIPEGTELKVEEIVKKDDQYQEYYNKVLDALQKDGKQQDFTLATVRFYDITLISDGKEIEPADTVNVTISYDNGISAKDADHVRVIHFTEDDKDGEIRASLLKDEDVEAKVDKKKLSEASFDAESFSVYGVVTLNDIGDLDGKTYGILNTQGGTKPKGIALMSTAQSSNTKLQGKETVVRVDPVTRIDNVYVAANSDITMWYFRQVEGDKYYLTTVVDGAPRYLRIDDSSVSLVDPEHLDENCLITIQAGTGNRVGKLRFRTEKGALRLNGTSFERVAATTNNDSVWMSLADLSDLKDDDFVVYTASKVSVSGAVGDDGTVNYDIKNGDAVILYTRIWNDETKKYDYYAIDYDGMLVQAYESGDTISWVGTKVNTMLWDFTEYYNEDGSLNYYYELQNQYSGKYIAPQVSGQSFLSDNTIGINLNGRRNKQYYSTILAWDDPYYDYASLMVRDGELISAPMFKADDFYFAKMTTVDTSEQLTKVATIDSNPFGITLKMQNYAQVASNNRSQEQTDVLQDLTYNQWTGVKNLLTKYIADGDDYPVSTKTGRSLHELFDETLTVNNQFLLSTYDETGYFEFDSTQNFAHLISSESDKWFGTPSPSGKPYAVGDFVIYDQIASTSESTGNTRRHGQFFPYNDLTEGSFITNMVNETDIHGEPLSSLDPRNGEKLYKLQYKNAANTDPRYVDYFFGMEMDASFMQSENGLDAWGHDLIFEFSGDDDFWLYIDGMLVLDLGGIHSALDGSVNFRTGEVIENGVSSTLRERFETAYKEKYRNKTQDEVDEWLNGIFKDNGTVFNDYSGHTMQMFYMERGAGASNLHMRFNLAPYTKGEVQLEKEVSGLEKVDPSMRFPFQVMYKDPNAPDDRFVSVTNADQFHVVDAQTGDPVAYLDSYSVDGLTYDHVFFLKPDQTISVLLPDESIEYYIQECGMDTGTYDVIKANDQVLQGTATAVEARKDFRIESSTVAGRKKVIYNNHVSPDAQKTLTITKQLWQDYEKTRPISVDDDDAEFRFRVYIGMDGNNYAVYNTGKYYVKDPEGHYCIYENGGFVSTGKTDLSQLDTRVPEGEWKSERDKATFYTSPGGAVDKIKAGYSVEIPELLEGTAFMVEERAYEIPSGYHLIDYEREGGFPDSESANSGAVSTQNEHVLVNNQHGYGLTLNKIWSDAPFMDDHDAIYFAVFLGDNQNKTLLRDSVRQLGRTATSINWFFPELEDGKNLNNYIAYEVTLTPGKYTVNSDGTVTLAEDCEVTIVDENETIIVGGNSSEHGYSANYEYTANYTRNWLTEEELENDVNARADTVKNSRPGIRLVKTDLIGNKLAGGRFDLIKGEDQRTRKTFVSDDDGLIAVAYLTQNEEYTLTEKAAPYKHLALIDSVTIKVGADNTVYVNGSEQDSSEGYYTIEQEKNPTAAQMPTVTIKNRRFTVKAVKVDQVSGAPIEGVKFELHREVKDYYTQNPMPDYGPIQGFESLVTDEEGLIPKINLDDLSAGIYYLREKETPSYYKPIGYDIRLTISPTGLVSVQKAEYSSGQGKWVFSDIPPEDGTNVSTNENGDVTIAVANKPEKTVRILKKNYDNEVLSDITFKLYKDTQIDDGKPKEDQEALLTGITSQGIMDLGALDTHITYYLFETETLDGYVLLDAPVIIYHQNDTWKATLHGNPLDVLTVIDGQMEISQITVYNSEGVELPYTGGSGTRLLYLFGGLLVLLSAAGLAIKKRREAL